MVKLFAMDYYFENYNLLMVKYIYYIFIIVLKIKKIKLTYKIYVPKYLQYLTCVSVTNNFTGRLPFFNLAATKSTTISNISKMPR